MEAGCASERAREREREQREREREAVQGAVVGAVGSGGRVARERDLLATHAALPSTGQAVVLAWRVKQAVALRISGGALSGTRASSGPSLKTLLRIAAARLGARR